MSIIRDFVTKLPAACGVPNEPVTFTWVDKDGVERAETKGLADIFGEMNAQMFAYELANPDGPLHRKHFESVFDRVYLGVGPWKDLASGGSGHALDLLVYVARNIDAKGTPWRGKSESEIQLKNSEMRPENSAVAALLSVEQASTLGNWA